MTIDIIGSGIGGLTTAIALEQKGYKVRLYEQAKAIKPVGAGIILGNNAMQVFKNLGIKNEIEQNGNPISSMNITKTNLNPLSKINLTYFERKFNSKNIAIHRGELQRILISKLKTTIKLDHQLKIIEKGKNDSILIFENGEKINSQILLGADGINSVVRKTIFPKYSIRNANQICWRGITNFCLPEQYRNELNEAWGNSDRFGFVQISKNTVYWYALKSFKSNADEYSLNNIEDYFKNYNTLIKDIIHSTDKNKINTAEIIDLKPTNIWYQENICLLGDAAHAATPNIGQGACQAIEDAHVLSECLEKYDTNKAFEQFQKLRSPKAHQVVKTSWMVGKMAHLSNPILTLIRNFILKTTPASISKKQNEKLYQLSKI